MGFVRGEHGRIDESFAGTEGESFGVTTVLVAAALGCHRHDLG